MRLYTPLSDREAGQAERGALSIDFYWVDRPDPIEASEDAVWIAIDVPDEQLGGFESGGASQLGYREFALPSSVTNQFQVQRVRLPL